MTPGQSSHPAQRFLATEAGGASLLLAATVLALVWANSPVSDAYDALWHTELGVTIGGHALREDLHFWVNDGLMAFFFFLVGLELRRELSLGELAEGRRALIPALAALGGMVVPALLFTALNAGGEGARGWGIVMATDIAFVVGLLALVAPRAPSSLRVFLLTLAIVDDIGAIVVIAVFYGDGVDLVALAVAAAVLPLILLINRLGAWRGPAYFVAGLVLWLAMVESGVHPTIAGVLLGVLVAVHPPRRAGAVSPNERLQLLWHPWTSYVIVPIFALANAGVHLDGDMLADAAGSTITLGVIVGLVLGKLVGVALTTTVAVRLGAGPMPAGVDRAQLTGGGALAGIGFTVALFITDLAFDDPRLQDQAKVGVLVASVVAAGLAAVIFRIAARGQRARARTSAPVVPD